eukprot:CAMPEP_0175748908 /NCGR_PEP_ID=MMETSP0097-20121207/59876_1 /TAXON_ID=311494 /ORGANISM="Alexandrium monilatum, Strain CCMP3105" /LENGTH=114 /DNA_ID=CAMNT_0017057445 /DNA_START=1 /DNA_END=345 /DNA_ORIENTATION=-
MGAWSESLQAVQSLAVTGRSSSSSRARGRCLGSQATARSQRSAPAPHPDGRTLSAVQGRATTASSPRVPTATTIGAVEAVCLRGRVLYPVAAGGWRRGIGVGRTAARADPEFPL